MRQQQLMAGEDNAVDALSHHKLIHPPTLSHSCQLAHSQLPASQHCPGGWLCNRHTVSQHISATV